MSNHTFACVSPAGATIELRLTYFRRLMLSIETGARSPGVIIRPEDEARFLEIHAFSYTTASQQFVCKALSADVLTIALSRGSYTLTIDDVTVTVTAATICDIANVARSLVQNKPTQAPVQPYAPKVGDRVTVTGLSMLRYDARGAVGTVKRIANGETHPVVVDFPDYNGACYRRAQVTLAVETKPKLREVGSRAVISRFQRDDLPVGQTVEILAVPPSAELPYTIRAVAPFFGARPRGAGEGVVSGKSLADALTPATQPIRHADGVTPVRVFPPAADAWETAASALEQAGLTSADPYVDIIQRTQPGGLTVRPSRTERGKVTLHLTGVRQDVGRRLTPAQARRLAFLLNREADAAERAA